MKPFKFNVYIHNNIVCNTYLHIPTEICIQGITNGSILLTVPYMVINKPKSTIKLKSRLSVRLHSMSMHLATRPIPCTTGQVHLLVQYKVK